MTDSTDIHFDGWTLDRSSGELSREGRMQRLPPQPLAMMVTLLDRAGEVVTREALVQVLWPKGIVDFDNSLMPSCESSARRWGTIPGSRGTSKRFRASGIDSSGG